MNLIIQLISGAVGGIIALAIISVIKTNLLNKKA